MTRRTVEIFTAGCRVCDDAVALVEQMACDSCEVITLDMHDDDVARRAGDIGIRSVPAVAIDGRLAECCAGRGVDAEALRSAGIGRPA